MIRIKFFASAVVLMLLTICLTGCPDSTPKITLTAVDCPKDDISISATKTVSGSPSNWVVSVVVTVKCGGELLSNAEIKFTPWIGDAIKLTTNNQGEASYRRTVSTSARPGELTVEVEIEGSDGVKSESITV